MVRIVSLSVCSLQFRLLTPLSPKRAELQALVLHSCVPCHNVADLLSRILARSLRSVRRFDPSIRQSPLSSSVIDANGSLFVALASCVKLSSRVSSLLSSSTFVFVMRIRHAPSLSSSRPPCPTSPPARTPSLKTHLAAAAAPWAALRRWPRCACTPCPSCARFAASRGTSKGPR